METRNLPPNPTLEVNWLAKFPCKKKRPAECTPLHSNLHKLNLHVQSTSVHHYSWKRVITVAGSPASRSTRGAASL